MDECPSPIDCPVRKRTVSSLLCHTCGNHIRVLYRAEGPPELQCSKWNWDLPEVGIKPEDSDPQ